MRIWSSTTGWRRTARRGDWVLLTVLLVCQPVSAAPPLPDMAPDLELLDFLGTWRTEDGAWIEPSQFGDSGPLSEPNPMPSSSEGTSREQKGENEYGTDASRTRDGRPTPQREQTDPYDAR